MATKVTIPAMGESINSGILASWLVKDNDYVKEGQALFELETDKITSEATAEVSGSLSIKVQAGEEVEIGQVVATIDENASIPDDDDATPGLTNTPTEPSVASKEIRTDSSATLSPAARKAAAETGIDSGSIAGTGKDGRVTKNDILSRKPETIPEKKSPTPLPSVPKEGHETREQMTSIRKKIAERLVNATQESAMLTTFNEVDMSAVIKLRKTHQDDFIDRHGIKLGFMSFFTKAVTHALHLVPEVNARIEGNEIIRQHYYDIGVAVGTEKGLMVPVLRDCEEKSFAEIEQDILEYAKRAREGRIQMSDLQGGVFTISNGGIYGSMLSTPILNYPQAAILGLHNIQQRAVVINGEIVARPMMYLALSYDHRLIDGKEAVTFLVTIKEAIQDPGRLLFDI